MTGEAELLDLFEVVRRLELVDEFGVQVVLDHARLAERHPLPGAGVLLVDLDECIGFSEIMEATVGGRC